MSVVISKITPGREENTFSVGMLIALSSWGMVFLTLVWGYMVFRMRTDVWWAGALDSSTLTLAVSNTAVIIASSLCLTIALKKQVRLPETWAWSAFGLGILFLVGQVLLWRRVLSAGLHWHKSIAGSFFFLLTGFHAVHIIGALIAVLILCLRFKEWQWTRTGIGIKYFWDFLLAVWLVMFIMIFIIQ